MYSEQWYDEHKYDIADIYHLLDILKQRYLQAEYLDIPVKAMYNDISTLLELQDVIQIEIANITRAIQKKDPTFFLKIENQHYSIYTSKHYPDCYWNDIESPDIVTHYFYQFARLLDLVFVGTEFRFEIQSSDLFPCCFYLETLEDANIIKNIFNFIDNFTVYKTFNGGKWEKLFTF